MRTDNLPAADVKKRNSGIELLRIIAMFSIVLLHIVGIGGINNAYPLHSAGYAAALLLRSVTFCSVNCYALISGYVGCTGRKNAAKHVKSILNILVQTLFWSFLIALIFFACGKTGIKGLAKSLFPLMMHQYWYSCAYIGLLLLSPLLNFLLQKLSVRMLRFIEITVITISVYLTVFFFGDPFGLSSGYSTLWLILLYLLGGCIRLDEGFFRLLKSRAAIKCAVCWGVIWLGTYAAQLITAMIFSTPRYDVAFLRYVSLPNLLVACVLLAAFSSADFSMPRWSEKAARCTFGVYLIHIHPLVITFLLDNRFAFFAKTPFFVMFFGVICIAAAIYAVCTLIEYARQLLFGIIKADRAITKTSEAICSLTEKYMRFFEKWM